MKFKIKPYYKNNYPLRGMLIKHPSLRVWIQEIQSLRISLDQIDIYPIPDMKPNTIWGCLIISDTELNSLSIGKHQACQLVCTNLIIPEKSIIYPKTNKEELENIFSAFPHVIHPDFGLVELKEPLKLLDMLSFPEEVSCFITKPKSPVFIPNQIKSFQVSPIPPEKVLKNLEENIFPKKKKLENKPLSIIEKGKLSLYKLLFNKKEGENRTNNTGSVIGKTGFAKMIETVFNTFSKKENSLADKLQQDFENLEERNRKELDKLLDMLKNNPEEGLKYAIPLDDGGVSRGGANGEFSLTKQWFDFSLLGNYRGSSSSSGSIDLGNDFTTLQKQYHASAQGLIKKGEHHKASFIYMKLLKNYSLAAQTMESGNHFQEAASIYLTQVKDKRKAAICYEKGHMIENAIELYDELGENEKVGDLYLDIKKGKQANIYFNKVVEVYNTKDQYLKSSLILRHKVNDENEAQNTLLQGWRKNKDGFNCLNNYFSNISDEKQLGKEIEAIYKNEVSNENREAFLKVIQYEYKKEHPNLNRIREVGYELISAQISFNPAIVSELKVFNPKDKELVKDTIRFKLHRKKGE